MPTVKQKIAFKEVVKGSSITKAMVKADYAVSTSKRTNKLTRTKGWEELTKNFLSDEELVKKHNEQLNSSKHSKLYFDIDDEDSLIEDVCKKLGVELLYIKNNKDKSGKTANVKAPDFFFRDLAIDKAYKIKGKYKNEGGDNKTLVLIVSGESANRFNVQPTRITEASSD